MRGVGWDVLRFFCVYTLALFLGCRIRGIAYRFFVARGLIKVLRCCGAFVTILRV